jgi:hypothetical protein
MAETYQLFAFPAQAAARRGEWNDCPPCSIGSGAQIGPVDQSMHMVGRGVRSRTSSASLLCSFSLISRVMQRVTSITRLIITRTRFG